MRHEAMFSRGAFNHHLARVFPQCGGLGRCAASVAESFASRTAALHRLPRRRATRFRPSRLIISPIARHCVICFTNVGDNSREASVFMPLVRGRSVWPSLANGWARISRRRRLSMCLFVVTALAGGWCFYAWWTAWPARLAIPVSVLSSPEAFSPDGTMLAINQPNGLAVRDAKTGREMPAWELPRRRYGGVFSPDGRTFVALTNLDLSNKPAFQINLIDTAIGHLRHDPDILRHG